MYLMKEKKMHESNQHLCCSKASSWRQLHN